MKRFHISISVGDFAASVADYSQRLGEPPCVVNENRYALWRTELLNFSISRKGDQPPGVVRHIGFEDDTQSGFREEQDCNGVTWEYFTRQAQEREIHDKIPGAVFAYAPQPVETQHASGEMSFRLLTGQDAEAFDRMRLRAVEDEPSAFLETVDEIKAISGTPFQRYIANGWIAGAFMGDTLVGISGLYRHKGEKLRHKGTVWGVYVVPPARERGLARRMIALLLDEARQAGLELVHISTDSANRVTMGLYQSLGFTPWGTDRRMIKLPERYVDDVMMVMSLI